MRITTHACPAGVLAACALAAVAATACNERPLATEPSPPQALDAGPRHEDPDSSEPAAATAGPELAAVRRATARFHNVEEAKAAGYLFHEPCQASEAGAMGIHAPNPSLVADGIIDPERPEVLLYLPKPGGGLRLVGVEYMQLVRLRNPATGVVAPWRSPSPWPANYVVVTPTPQLFGQTFQGPMRGHSATMPWHWDLHVWAWAHNPDGMFAQWNPALQCG